MELTPDDVGVEREQKAYMINLLVILLHVGFFSARAQNISLQIPNGCAVAITPGVSVQELCPTSSSNQTFVSPGGGLGLSLSSGAISSSGLSNTSSGSLAVSSSDPCTDAFSGIAPIPGLSCGTSSQSARSSAQVGGGASATNGSTSGSSGGLTSSNCDFEPNIGCP